MSKQRLIGILTLGGTVVLSLALVSVPTETMLRYVGTDNAYVFMYLIAFLGSISTFASIPYPLILISLVGGGLDPFYAGVVSALGVSTSDTFTFFAARRGRALLSPHLTASLTKYAHWLQKYPRLFMPCLILYGTFSPVSNDFAVISLALMKYRFRRVVPTLAVGNMIYNVSIAFLGVYAHDWMMGWF